jgi:uncharacterized phage protein gp47/JayE
MAEIKKINGGQVIDYMARDYDSILQSMRDLIPDKLPEWKSYQSEADFGNVLLELFAHMGDILSYYQDRIANESFLGTAQTRQSIIHHLRLIGYTLSTAAPASATLTLTVPASRTDTIQIVKGNAFATKSQKDKPSARFEYTAEQPLVIDFSKLTGVNGKKHFKGIPVEEGRLFANENIGISDGKANQRFTLAHKGLILRSLGIGSAVNSDIILTTSIGSKTDSWALRDSLAFSREGQKDYVIDIDDNDVATVVFGDGSFGMIPQTGAGIFATYRVGGGVKGNLPKNSIQTIVDAPQLSLLGAQVTNPQAATGGSDRESIAHAVMHAPNVFRSLKRAVTAEDYKALALDCKGVGKVRAEAGNWNRVNLYVAPEGGGNTNDILKKNLIAYFEDKRPVTTIVEIEDVDYVKIYVKANIGVERYYLEEDIKQKVQNAANEILSFDNVDFGQTIYLSKFYEAIEAIEGVDYVTIIEFYEYRSDQQSRGYMMTDGHTEMVKPDGKIELGLNEIPCIPDDPEDADFAGGISVIITHEV